MKESDASAQGDARRPVLFDIEYVRRLERQNRAWKLGVLVVLLAFGLSLAAGVRAQQNGQNGQAPAAPDESLNFVLRDASGKRLGEWVVKNGSISEIAIGSQGPTFEPGPKIEPIPPANGQHAPNGQTPASLIQAEVLLRDGAGKRIGDWTVKTGALLECHDPAGKLIWSIPMKAIGIPQ